MALRNLTTMLANICMCAAATIPKASSVHTAVVVTAHLHNSNLEYIHVNETNLCHEAIAQLTVIKNSRKPVITIWRIGFQDNDHLLSSIIAAIS